MNIEYIVHVSVQGCVVEGSRSNRNTQPSTQGYTFINHNYSVFTNLLILSSKNEQELQVNFIMSQK